MSEESLKNYLLWLNERGLDTYLPTELEIPVDDTPAINISDEHFKPYIGSQPEITVVISCTSSDLSQLPSDEKLLLGKLFKAIELKFDQLAIIPCTPENESFLPTELDRLQEDFKINKFIVFGSGLGRIFGTEELGVFAYRRTNNAYGVCTYSLKELLENESLKRPVWEHLKLFQSKKSPQ